jgi:hypothetical protein
LLLIYTCNRFYFENFSFSIIGNNIIFMKMPLRRIELFYIANWSIPLSLISYFINCIMINLFLIAYKISSFKFTFFITKFNYLFFVFKFLQTNKNCVIYHFKTWSMVRKVCIIILMTFTIEYKNKKKVKSVIDLGIYFKKKFNKQQDIHFLVYKLLFLLYLLLLHHPDSVL